MPCSLSFADEFFVDGDIDAIEPSDRPTSVYQALLSMSDDTWNRVARDVFDADPERLDPLAVLDRVRETDTCSHLDTPVEVWIDEDGWYDVLVHDGADQPR